MTSKTEFPTFDPNDARQRSDFLIWAAETARRHAKSTYPGIRVEDAEDFAQEAALHFVRIGFESWDPARGTITAWATTTIQNLAASTLVNAARTIPLSADDRRRASWLRTAPDGSAEQKAAWMNDRFTLKTTAADVVVVEAAASARYLGEDEVIVANDAPAVEGMDPAIEAWLDTLPAKTRDAINAVAFTSHLRDAAALAGVKDPRTVLSRARKALEGAPAEVKEALGLVAA